MSTNTINLTRVMKLLLIGFFSVFLMVGAASAASAIDFGFGDGDEVDGVENGDMTGGPGGWDLVQNKNANRQEANTGGSTERVENGPSCGPKQLMGPGSAYLYSDCWRSGYAYYPVRSDADVDRLRENQYPLSAAAMVHCAPVSSEGNWKREQNGKTLVGVQISFQFLSHKNLYMDDPAADGIYWVGRLNSDPSALDYYRNLRYDCVYQQWEDVSVNRLCIVAIDLKINKNRGIGNIGTIASKRSITPWGSGNQTLAACEASNRAFDSIKRTLTEFGRYDGSSRVYYQPITVRTYKNAPSGHIKPPDEIIRLGAVTSRPGPNLYAQITCDPNYTGIGTNRSQVYRGGPWSWTWSDCDPTVPNTPGYQEAYRCTNADTATLNGTSGLKKATVFRDGEKNRLSWKNPSIGGSRLVSVTPRDTKVIRTGTPWNTPRSMPAGKNNVTLHTPGGTNVLAKGNSWMPGRQAAFDFTANWASDAGKPTVISPTWRFDATLMTSGIRIDDITANFNKNSGSWSINVNSSKVNVPIHATATCSSKFTFDVVRAVNDAG